MGWTKTICCNTRKIHLFSEEWADLVQQRDGLKKECLKYLGGKACVAGVPDVVAGINPHVDLLAQAYVALVKEELTGHADQETSMRCMHATALVFSDMWWFPASLVSRYSERNDALDVVNRTGESATDPEALKLLVEAYENTDVSAKSDTAAEVLDTAQVLSDTYVKAFAEFQTSLESPEISVVTHHASLIADVVEQMMALLHYTKPKTEKDFTEFSLPESHPQARR